MKVRQLLRTKKRWTQGVYARTKSGRMVSSLSPSAVQFCLVGAITRCYHNGTERLEIARKVRSAIRCDAISGWNDNPERKWSEVKALIKKLDI